MDNTKANIELQIYKKALEQIRAAINIEDAKGIAYEALSRGDELE